MEDWAKSPDDEAASRTSSAIRGQLETMGRLVEKLETTERELQEKEGYFQAILNTIQTGILLIDPQSHTVVEANAGALAMIGLPKEHVIGKSCEEFFCLGDKATCPMNTSQSEMLYNYEGLLQPFGDEPIQVLKNVSLIDYQGKEHFLESFVDISPLKRAQRALERMANIDALTECYTRRHFMEHAHAAFARVSRYNRPLSLVMVDLDHFKSVNDTYGHAAGDVCLKIAARVIKDGLRESDVLGRLGGEEFCLLLPETCGNDAVRAAERLRKTLEKTPIDADGAVFHVTGSFGAAECSPRDDDVEATLKRADEALYAAKRAGRNRVVLADTP